MTIFDRDTWRGSEPSVTRYNNLMGMCCSAFAFLYDMHTGHRHKPYILIGCPYLVTVFKILSHRHFLHFYKCLSSYGTLNSHQAIHHCNRRTYLKQVTIQKHLARIPKGFFFFTT